MTQCVVAIESIGLQYRLGLLTPDECRQLIEIGQSLLQAATVTDEHSGEETNHQGRTSDMAWPERANYPILQAIAADIARLTGVPADCQEPLQILRYSPGGEYKPHYDAFAADAPTLRQGGNRQLSLILYLNAVEEGGQTDFPQLGVRVAPLPGAGVLFRNLDTSGQRHPLSLHAGLPVVKGEKWIATQWIREGPYV